jgi:molybdate transport system regulatory protein
MTSSRSGRGAPVDAAEAVDAPIVGARAWLEWHGRNLLGPGRVELLEGIQRTGSISSAARLMGVSYRAAWQWIADMNEAAKRPLVQTATGGRGGGGASLTVTGHALVRAYRLLDSRLDRFRGEMDRELARLFGGDRDG